jgi:hypothetical protein
MTARQLLNALQKLSSDRLDQKVVAVTSAAGVSYDVSGPFKWKVSDRDCAGVLCDMEVGEEYVGLSLG